MKLSTEQIILDVACKHFMEKGYSGARMQQIADEAGINKALLHYYYRSKMQLYEAAIGQTLDKILPKLTSALSGNTRFWEKVEALVKTYINTFLVEPQIPFFILSELSQKRESLISALKSRSEHFPVVLNFMSEIQSEIQDGRLTDLPPVHIFLNLMSMSAFPFIAKPIFCTVFDFSDKQFNGIMEDRTAIIMQFTKAALEVKTSKS